MKTFRQRVLSGEVLSGTWLNLASTLTTEIAGRAGFDWVLIDREHGAGDQESLLYQLQAIHSTAACPIVRLPCNDAARVKLTLDLGAGGIMIPYVNNAEEARHAVAGLRYPPQGIRGVARFSRAAGFGMDFETYFARANETLVTVVQIETVEAVEKCEEIAAVDGVDVLFVGPLDLSVNMGIPQQFNDHDFRAAIRKVIAVAKEAGKAAGTLVMGAEQLPAALADGYTFLAAASDGSMVANGMKNLAAAFAAAKSLTG